jgi:hypothetical protein
LQVQPRTADELFKKHRNNGLLIDTNLLLLLVIGNFKRDLIGKHKRTMSFTQEDFQKLGFIKNQFDKLLTTPNILTEADNLGRQMPREYWQGFSKSLRDLALHFAETYVPSGAVVKSKHFEKLGLADSAAIQMGNAKLLITDDFALYGIALSAGLDAINFSHLRYNWNA